MKDDVWKNKLRVLYVLGPGSCRGYRMYLIFMDLCRSLINSPGYFFQATPLIYPVDYFHRLYASQL
jgi:hypothetical protein